MRKNLIALAFAVLLLASVSTDAVAESENAPYNVTLSWTGNAAMTQTFIWRDTVELAEYVQLAPQAQYEKTGFDSAEQTAAACRDISLDGSGVWHYEATAEGLKAATVYCYRVGGENGWSETETFTTSDPASDSLAFVYMGDIQINSSMTEEYALWEKLSKAAYAKAPDIAFGLLGGDIVESGISVLQFDCFLENAEPVFSNIPLMPANGNHESNFIGGKPELYLDVFALPENGPENFIEEFYSFDYANCHVLVLNSWVWSGEQEMTDEDYARISNWIADDLESSTSDWQIVVTHVPVYSVTSDTTADKLKKYWAPLFEKYGVDLVFEGHQHVYSRSYPMYEGTIDYENGITYIMGNAGQKFYSSADETYSEKTIYNTATYQIVRIGGGSLTVQTFDINGNELDYCTVMQREITKKIPIFSDVTEDRWYKTAVDYAAINGLMSGISETAFSPDVALTRAMSATILWRMAGCPKVADTDNFTDIASTDWYSDAAAWASESGIMSGYGNGWFGPNDAVTREQLSAILYRYAGSPAAETAETLLQSFLDAASVSAWASDAMAWAVSEGILSGSGGMLEPKCGATRAQVAQILMSFIIE